VNKIDTVYPQEVINVIEALENRGFEAFLVGGCVRDVLLGRKPKDWDITTNANPTQIQSLFIKTVYENEYGTVAIINEETEDETLRKIEVTPYRIEGIYSDSRHPDSVKYSQNIEDDLKRRDFTVNAVAIKIKDNAISSIVDPYGGVKDIRDNVIRSVGNPDDRFKEDALRLIRAIRLASELGFSIENETMKSIRLNSALLNKIATERIRDEFTKIIMSNKPMLALNISHETGLLKHFLPEIEDGIGVKQNQAHKYDVWEHLMRSLQCAADKDFTLEVRLAALFHDISKPKNKGFSHETNTITFYGHEVEGSRETYKIMTRLKYPKQIVSKVCKLVRWHMFFSDTETITLSSVRRLVVNVGKENIWDLMNLRVCDRVGTGRPKEEPYRLRKYMSMIEEALRDPISVSLLKIDGKRIMEVCSIGAGPRVGNILYALFNEVMKDPKKNESSILENMATELNKLDDVKLEILGEEGRNIKENIETKDIVSIRNKYHVK